MRGDEGRVRGEGDARGSRRGGVLNAAAFHATFFLFLN